jgi:hypothetical protein
MTREAEMQAGRDQLAETVRANIRAELERQDLKQTGLGKLLVDGDDDSGAGVRRVRRLLAPGSKPDTDAIADFAAALGLEPHELVTPPGRRRRRAKAHDQTK